MKIRTQLFANIRLALCKYSTQLPQKIQTPKARLQNTYVTQNTFKTPPQEQETSITN